MEKEREGRETPSAGDKDGGKQASWGSEGSAWEAGGGQQTGSPSTPFPVPPPASAAGATGRGAGQAGDCGGAEQPHRGECPLPFPCPGDTPPPGPWHPVGAQAGGAGWAAGPGSGLPGDSGAQTLRALGCPRGQGHCWAAAWPRPTPPLSSSSSSSRCPTMLPLCPSPLALLAWWAAAPRGCWPCPEHWPPRLSWLRPPRRTGQVGRPRDPEVSGQHRVAGAGGQGWGGGLAGHPIQSTGRTEA